MSNMETQQPSQVLIMSSIQDIPTNILILDIWFAVRPQSNELVHLEILDNGHNSLWEAFVPAEEIPMLTRLHNALREEYIYLLNSSGGQL